MHIKRKTVSNFWPVAKTGTKYMAVPLHDKENSVPLVVFIRDVLEIVKTMKEFERILREKKILVNGKIIIEPNYPIIFGDSISIPSVKKYFKVELNGKRFELKEVSEKETESRIYKVIGKKILSGKKVQINLDNGKNILSNDKIKTGDFLIIENQTRKINKIISVEKGMEAIVIKGKHCGKEGKILDLTKEGENLIVKIKTKTEELKVNLNALYAK
jgi:small subunit ribosomal protein S4e